MTRVAVSGTSVSTLAVMSCTVSVPAGPGQRREQHQVVVACLKDLGARDRVFEGTVNAAGDDGAEFGAESSGIHVAGVTDQVVPDLRGRTARQIRTEHGHELIVDVLTERPDAEGCRRRDRARHRR